MSSSSPIIMRKDGRDLMQLRPISLSVGDIVASSTSSSTSGSAKYRCGSSCVLAILHGPSTAKAQSERYDQAVIQVTIQRTTAGNSGAGIGAEAAKLLAGHERRRQQIEENRIASLIRRILMSTVIDVTKFPRCVIALNLQILQEDGSLEACCVNAAMGAVLDSAISCKTTVAAVNVGMMVNSQPILDLTDLEERRFLQQQQKEENEFSTSDVNNSTISKLIISKGTFVVSYPTNAGGVVATSDLVFYEDENENNSKSNNSTPTDQLTLFNKMERAANAAAGRLFNIFRDSCSKSDEADVEEEAPALANEDAAV